MGKKRGYFVGFLFTAALAAWYLLSRGFADAAGREKWRLLCDALASPGVLLLCAGALAFCRRQGALDGLGYGLRRLLPGQRESFGDYAARKRAARAGGYGYLLVTGGVSTLLSLLALGMYYWM